MQAHRLLDRLMPKAKALGVAAGTLRNCGHIGRLGEYAEAAARERLAFFGTVNSHGSGRRVAPPGGTEGRISTNPICLGVPTSGEPVVLDFGTSVAAEGKVRVHFQKKEPAPDGLAARPRRPADDRPGRAVRRPAREHPAVRRAAGVQGVRPRAAARPALRRAVRRAVQQPERPARRESATRSCSPCSTRPRSAGRTTSSQETDGLTAYVRGCPPADPACPITLPGDPERTIPGQRGYSDGIPIPDGTWELIAKAAAERNVALPI